MHLWLLFETFVQPFSPVVSSNPAVDVFSVHLRRGYFLYSVSQVEVNISVNGVPEVDHHISRVVLIFLLAQVRDRVSVLSSNFMSQTQFIYLNLVIILKYIKVFLFIQI